MNVRCMLRSGSGIGFRRWNCGGGGGSSIRVVSAAGMPASFSTSYTFPRPALAGGGGTLYATRQVRVVAAARDLAGFSRARSRERSYKAAGGLVREERDYLLADIHRPLWVLDGDVKEVTAQVRNVRERVGYLQARFAAGATRFDASLKTAREEDKGDAAGLRSDLQRAKVELREDLKRAKEELRKDVTRA
jgi:hypothetical protein